jgi:GDP-4-dehydro-6-deoxy-D-mannose reductase
VNDVLITGAAGLIGQSLSRRLRGDGRNVVALTRMHGDVADEALWERLPPARAVVHLAARSYVPDSWCEPAAFTATNVAGTQLALEWCRKHRARMVLASAYVYGIPERLPISESDRVQPNNPYALSKYLGEQCAEFAARIHNLDVTVLRLFNVFGAGQREDFLLPTLIRQLDGPDIRVTDLTPRRDYIYVDDVVDAIVQALDGPEGYHCFNIGGGRSYSVAEIVEQLQSVAGTSLPVISSGKLRPHEIPDVWADITFARSVLGWKPVFSLAEGLRHMLEVNRS